MLKVKTPSFLYRNYLYRKLADRMSPEQGSFLEIGVGSGEFTSYLEQRGFQGMGIDFSQEALAKVKDRLTQDKIELKHLNLFDLESEGTFDFIFAFEVLEHIENEGVAAGKISKMLKSGGLFMFSVPANRKDYGKGDKSKGHFRRYDRVDIQELMKNRLNIETIWKYGFPLLSMIRALTKFKKTKKTESMENRTKSSGIEEDCSLFWRYIFQEKYLWPLFKVMDFFLNTDKGVGYIVVAKKA